MKFTLTMDTDNAAFEDDPGAEVARILHKVAAYLEHGHESGTCIDHNGDTTGSWALEGETDNE